MSDAPEVRVDRPRLRVVTVGRLLVNRWQGVVGLEDVRALRLAQREFLGGLPERRLAVLSWFTAAASLQLEEPARLEGAAIASEAGPHLIALLQIAEGSGFRGAAVRGVLAGVQLLSRSQYPSRVVDSLERGRRWLLEALRAEGAPLADEALDAACALSAFPGSERAQRPPVGS